LSLQEKTIDHILEELKEHKKKEEVIIERMEKIAGVLEKTPCYRMAIGELDLQQMQTEEMFKILIVDDDEFLADTFKMLLEGSGFSVHIALSGIEALQKNNKTPFDLAIVDYKLPDMNGQELSMRLKEENKEINVVILTGQIDAIRDHGGLINMDEVLVKPVNPDELIKITEKMSQRN